MLDRKKIALRIGISLITILTISIIALFLVYIRVSRTIGFVEKNKTLVLIFEDIRFERISFSKKHLISIVFKSKCRLKPRITKFESCTEFIYWNIQGKEFSTPEYEHVSAFNVLFERKIKESRKNKTGYIKWITKRSD